jgi:RimJ/RimL family protein N-acetyltransferase
MYGRLADWQSIRLSRARASVAARGGSAGVQPPRARKVTLRVLGHNVGARRLYERGGLVPEGVLRDEFLLEGRHVDDVLMACHLVAPVP